MKYQFDADEDILLGGGIDIKDSDLSDGDIVEERYQNILMYCRDTFTEISFMVGDIANEIVANSAMSGLHVTANRIYAAVGKYCGRAARTVRYYAETASFYPKEIREKYSNVPFTTFVLARQFPGMWDKILDYADAHPEISTAALRTHFINITNEIARNSRIDVSVVGDGDSQSNQELTRPENDTENDALVEIDNSDLAFEDADLMPKLAESEYDIDGVMRAASDCIISLSKMLAELKYFKAVVASSGMSRMMTEEDFARVNDVIGQAMLEMRSVSRIAALVRGGGVGGARILQSGEISPLPGDLLSAELTVKK